MYDDVVKRLASLGYVVTDADEWAINFIIEKMTEYVKNECNVSKVPDGLRCVVVDMVCGEFLNAKKGTGQLDGFDVETAVKQIHEGDTSVTFAVADNSITLDGLIGWLMNRGKAQFVTFRRLRW